MDIKRCAAFVAAVDTNSLSGAAKQLGYTPSGIIRLINALEEELGFPLLIRSSTGVEPTLEGQKMYPLLRDVVNLNDQALQTSARIRGLAEGTLTVGALSSVAGVWLPQVIKEYQSMYPAVKVNVVEGSDARLTSLLEHHEIDCCIFHGDHSKMEWEPLGQQELMAWLPAGSPLAKHGSILLVEFDGQPFVRVHPQDHDTFEQIFLEKGIEPDVRFTVGECYTAWCMVDAKLGLSLNAKGINKGWTGNVDVLPLSPRRFIEFGIATLPSIGPSPAVEEFVAVAKRYKDTWPQ